MYFQNFLYVMAVYTCTMHIFLPGPSAELAQLVNLHSKALTDNLAANLKGLTSANVVAHWFNAYTKISMEKHRCSISP